MHVLRLASAASNYLIWFQPLTRLANSLNGRHSPKAFKSVVRFFFGSGLDKANIIGLWGFIKNRTTYEDKEAYSIGRANS